MPALCGIYKITCTTSNRVYVGSSVNVEVRWSQHRGDLARNVHFNKHLQRAWAKHGIASFCCEVLEEVQEAGLLEREAFWIQVLDACNPERGFNQCEVPQRGFRLRMTLETRQRMSVSHRGKPGPVFSEEVLRRFSEARRGRPNHAQTQATRDKISRGNRGKVRSPEHCLRMSLARTGVKRGPQSEDHKRKRIEAMRATLARKKEASLATSHSV